MKKGHAGPITSPTPNRGSGRGQPAINTEDLHRRLDARDVDVLAVRPAAGYYAGTISVNRKTSTRCPPPPSATARPKGVDEAHAGGLRRARDQWLAGRGRPAEQRLSARCSRQVPADQRPWEDGF